MFFSQQTIEKTLFENQVEPTFSPNRSISNFLLAEKTTKPRRVRSAVSIRKNRQKTFPNSPPEFVLFTPFAVRFLLRRSIERRISTFSRCRSPSSRRRVVQLDLDVFAVSLSQSVAFERNPLAERFRLEFVDGLQHKSIDHAGLFRTHVGNRTDFRRNFDENRLVQAERKEAFGQNKSFAQHEFSRPFRTSSTRSQASAMVCDHHQLFDRFISLVGRYSLLLFNVADR